MAVLTKYSETEELGGGRFHLEQHLRPISYERNGYPRRITDVLANSGAQDLTIGTDELVQFRLRDKLAGNSPLVHFGAGNSHVRFTPLNTNNVDAVVKNNTITFPEAWNGADLRLAIGGHILRKDILLKTGHPKSFSFRLDEHAGLNLVTLETPEFRILPPVLIAPTGLLSVPLKWVQTAQGGKTVLTVTLPAGDYAGWTLDPTLTLQPDATAGVDTQIWGNVPQNIANYGVQADMWTGELGTLDLGALRSLIKFDLSSLPDAAIITSTTLTLYLIQENSTNARSLKVYRQKRAWVEGTRSGVEDSPATGATWVRYDTTNNWSTAGGFHADDCEQTDIGSISLSATEATSASKGISLTPTTKAALDLGNGWLLKMDTENNDAYNWATSDNATAGNRPQLAVVYSVPSFIPGIMRHHFIPALGVN